MKGLGAFCCNLGSAGSPIIFAARAISLAIRGIEGRIEHGDSFHNDRHQDLRADYILANPPFNVSDWGGERLRDDQRWEHGVPPAGAARHGGLCDGQRLHVVEPVR